MKIRLEVDLTPGELRQAFGLPDVAGLQEDLIQYVRDRVAAGVDIGEAISMIKNLVPDGMHAPARVQKLFGKALAKFNRDEKTTFKVNITEEDADEDDDDDFEPITPIKKSASKKAAAKKKPDQ